MKYNDLSNVLETERQLRMHCESLPCFLNDGKLINHLSNWLKFLQPVLLYLCDMISI